MKSAAAILLLAAGAAAQQPVTTQTQPASQQPPASLTTVLHESAPPAPAEAASLATVSTEGVSLGGPMSVANGFAAIGNNGAVTADDKTVHLKLTRGGNLNVCATTQVHLSTDTTVSGGGLMIALNPGPSRVTTSPVSSPMSSSLPTCVFSSPVRASSTSASASTIRVTPALTTTATTPPTCWPLTSSKAAPTASSPTSACSSSTAACSRSSITSGSPAAVLRPRPRLSQRRCPRWCARPHTPHQRPDQHVPAQPSLLRSGEPIPPRRERRAQGSLRTVVDPDRSSWAGPGSGHRSACLQRRDSAADHRGRSETSSAVCGNCDPSARTGQTQKALRLRPLLPQGLRPALARAPPAPGIESNLPE